MNIGFEAKRVFQNNTGLGNYARTLVSSLATYFPEHQYFLFAPKETDQFRTALYTNIKSVLPKAALHKLLPHMWRSNWVTKDLLKNNISLYHGLSHEIPLGIEKTKVKSVVTIHDLIFERYPNQFKKIDQSIYRKKFKHSCEKADRIIAISEQTKSDIISFYNIQENKIDVCYQSCNPTFSKSHLPINDALRQQLQLPHEYFISVGSIIERKNLLHICAAYKFKPNLQPLVVVGRGDWYEKTVRKKIAAWDLQKKIIFLNDIAQSAQIKIDDALLAQLYKGATALVYVSIFEGFGIPILEAQAAGTPVITSNISCMPEAGGIAASYVNPFDVEEIAEAMLALQQSKSEREHCIELGLINAKKFTPLHCAKQVMQTYKSLG